MIDDEKDIVESIDYNLSKAGYKVYRAYDGEDGLKYAMEKIPDLIILDLMLPGRSGLEILEALRRRDEQTLVLILTACDAVGKPWPAGRRSSRQATLEKAHAGCLWHLLLCFSVG